MVLTNLRWPAVLLLLGCLGSILACGRVGVVLKRRDVGSAGRDAGPDASPPGDPDAGCTSDCPDLHGTLECGSGDCVWSCGNGYADCDGVDANGCEMSVMDSVAGCGTCTFTCQNAHGEASCELGLCTPSCAADYADCDGDAANGCETQLSSAQHCGGCGLGCSNLHGDTRCQAGACLPSCDSGYADCDGRPDNGCETRVESDPTHCGSCGRLCNLASEVCVAADCQLSPCVSGRGECDGNTADACETDLASSAEHCGFCGNACAAANGSATCAQGDCQVSGCDAGRGDCDGLYTNGCEVALTSSVAHCGACDRACTNPHGSTSCSASACVPSCSSGFGDCDASRDNGCELALDSVTNCGMCGRVCPGNGGTPLCNAGVCTTQCDLGGTFALKLRLPVNWPQTSTLESGDGEFTLWAQLTLSQSGVSLSGTLTPCGIVVPDFDVQVLNETYGVTYPNSAFDRTPPLPSTTVSGTLGAVTPGSTFALARSALLWGVMLADPVDDSWPSRGALMQLDSDADGKPGITANYKTGGGYSAVPTSYLASVRANRGYLATRTLFSLSGTLTSCSQSSGSANASSIDTHTLGCRTTGGSDCNGTQTAYMDDNAPDYRTEPSSYSMSKLADGASCADVRAALP